MMPLFCFIIFTQKEKKIKKHILLLFQFKIYNCTKLVISLLFSDSIISYQKNQGSVGKHKRRKILKKNPWPRASTFQGSSEVVVLDLILTFQFSSNILTKNYLKWTLWSIPGPHHIRSSRSSNKGKINWLHKQVRGFVTKSKNPWANLFAFFLLRQFDFLNPHDLLFRHVRFSNSSFQFRLLIGLVDIQTGKKRGECY